MVNPSHTITARQLFDAMIALSPSTCPGASASAGAGPSTSTSPAAVGRNPGANPNLSSDASPGFVAEAKIRWGNKEKMGETETNQSTLEMGTSLDMGRNLLGSYGMPPWTSSSLLRTDSHEINPSSFTTAATTTTAAASSTAPMSLAMMTIPTPDSYSWFMLVQVLLPSHFPSAKKPSKIPSNTHFGTSHPHFLQISSSFTTNHTLFQSADFLN